MTFLELAAIVLEEAERPMTANKIWEFTIAKGI